MPQNIQYYHFSKDLNHALTNADSMNSDPRLMSSQLSNDEDSIGGNSFTGLGEERQPGGMEPNIAGISSMENPGGTQQIGDGQATLEGPQGGNMTQYGIEIVL